MVRGPRDYDAWLADYDDPDSALCWRLTQVQDAIERVLDAGVEPVRVISACAGDGRDILGVLARRDDATRVQATLLEIHPVVADRAEATAAEQGMSGQVEIRRVDAGLSDAYAGLAPAELVLLVGIFGNINDADLRATIAASPQLCATGGTLIWSRGRGGELTDRNDDIRGWLAAAGFAELDYATLERGSRPSIGVVRYDGPPVPLVPAQRWFTFER